MELYNKVEHGPEMDQLRNKLEQAGGQHSLAEVDRANENLVKQALTLMKSNKCDALFEFQSDCLINGPPELIQHLTYLLRSYITHGIVPCFILLCILLLLVKDNLSDLRTSELLPAAKAVGSCHSPD